MAEWLTWVNNPEAWIALFTLILLEIVLGIDNIVFISILSDRLPPSQRPRARQLGLAVALMTRIMLLLSLAWMARLTKPLLSVLGVGISGRDMILLAGGLFLLVKATLEIYDKLEGEEGEKDAKVMGGFTAVILQIGIMDIVFSLDSVITAVGMANDIPVMVIAVVAAVLFMMIAVNPVSNFIDQHPSVKILALSFLIMIGMVLVAEGLSFHVPKGYVYFAMAFSVFVEMINIRIKGARAVPPVELRRPYHDHHQDSSGSK
ncbi:MAG TPA: TerC family protein [Candidatus Acidoferrales bacterium]|nr:TerC family protein [Candidatus Acidoferrales bacterium]